MKRLILIAWIGFAGVGLLTAQSPGDPSDGVRIEWDEANSWWRVKWWGKSGHTYFIQQSDDLGNPWEWVPVIEAGNDSIREWGFTTTGDRFFVRLRHIDIPTIEPWTDDFDGDGVSNFSELWSGTDPLKFADADGDGIPDDWETYYALDPNDPEDASGDIDADGLCNLGEYQAGTNPYYSDSDGDGLRDGDEVNLHGSNPLVSDSDGDGIPDGWEVAHGLDPLDPDDAQFDTDGDGLDNLTEYHLGADPSNADTDGDGIPDGWEVVHGLDPVVPGDSSLDGDDDGLTNLQEYGAGTDPTKFSSGGNGVADGWWLQHGLDPSSDSSQDTDGDGRSNLDEFLAGTDPNVIDATPDYPFPDDAPSYLTATENPDGSYDLSWADGATNRKRFVIQRKKDDGTWENIAVVGPSIRAYHVPASQ